MVRAIAQLARAMNITTVAEYVETEEIRARVRMLGVDYGQGFAIARPVPVQDSRTKIWCHCVKRSTRISARRRSSS